MKDHCRRFAAQGSRGQGHLARRHQERPSRHRRRTRIPAPASPTSARLQSAREALTRQQAESVAEVQRLDAGVVSVNLEVHGDATLGAYDLRRDKKQLCPNAVLPELGDDVELVEPCGEAAVLDGPREGQDGKAYCNAVLPRDQDAAAFRTRDDPKERPRDGIARHTHPMLVELDAEKRRNVGDVTVALRK